MQSQQAKRSESSADDSKSAHSQGASEVRRHVPLREIDRSQRSSVATSQQFVQVPVRGPPNGGTSESPLDWRAEKMNPGAAPPCECKGTTATTRYGVSPSNDPNPGGRLEGFRQPLIMVCKRAASHDTPEWGARSSPSSRTKQRRETRLNISSTRGLATRQGQLPQKPILSDQILSAAWP